MLDKLLNKLNMTMLAYNNTILKGRVDKVNDDGTANVQIDDRLILINLDVPATYYKGVKVSAPIKVGSTALLIAEQGIIKDAKIVSILYNDDNDPLPIIDGTHYIKFDTGVEIKHNGGNLTITGAKKVSITGDLEVTGTITGTKDVIGGGKSLKDHTHSGVQSGGSNTGKPV